MRSLFERKPGVIVLNRPATLNKQRYRSIKMPAYVAERVHARLLVSLR